MNESISNLKMNQKMNLLSSVLLCTHTVIDHWPSYQSSNYMQSMKNFCVWAYFSVDFEMSFLENILETSFNLTMTQFPAKKCDR